MIRGKILGKHILGMALLTALTAFPVLAVGDIIGFEPHYWDQSMNGTLRADGDTLEGTTVDLQDTLGLQDSDSLYSGRFWIHWLKRNYLFLTTAHSGYSGKQTLASPVVFDDRTFNAGEEVKSHLETDLKSLVYGYNFLDLRLVKMSFRLGADRLGLDTKLDSQTTPTRVSTSDSVTYPVAGLGAAFEPMPWLRFVGEIDGLEAHISGNHVHFYDGRLQMEVYWAHIFGITAGYRKVKIDMDLEGYGAADLNQKGPYAGFVVRF